MPVFARRAVIVRMLHERHLWDRQSSAKAPSITLMEAATGSLNRLAGYFPDMEPASGAFLWQRMSLRPSTETFNE
jgi:hypothetical protein